MQLLRSLGRLARGLSALFWGLPATLIVCAEITKADALRPVALVLVLVANGLLLFGLWQLGDFQKQERPWRAALDWATLFAVLDLGLSPFLFAFSRFPDRLWFRLEIGAMILSGLFFLFSLNIVLKRLGAMLPDETLRHETNEFTLFNRWLLALWLVFITLAILATHFDLQERFDQVIWAWLERSAIALLLFLGLSPLAITMALIWKIKEVIFDGVFGPR